MQRFLITAVTALLVGCCAPCALARPQLGQYYSQEVHKVIYPSPSVAQAEVQRAIAKATREHKRVLLDFGGNWCGDCKVLDYYFHWPPNASLLHRNFVLVDINIGRYNHNLDLTRKYGIPIHKGVPALAVLSSHGKLLHSQTGGQFENMSRVSPESVTAFLNGWKPSQ